MFYITRRLKSRSPQSCCGRYWCNSNRVTSLQNLSTNQKSTKIDIVFLTNLNKFTRFTTMTTEISVYEAALTDPRLILDAFAPEELYQGAIDLPGIKSVFDEPEAEPIDLSDTFSVGDVLTIAAEGESESDHKVTGWIEIDHWKYGKFFIPRLERCA